MGKKEKGGRKRSKRMEESGMKYDQSLKTCSGTAVLIDLLYTNNHNFSVTTDTRKLQR